tara:strand:+ start:815 stop:1231 length:417 start_codon:yes stop_codon:yes gene_type:complete
MSSPSVLIKRGGVKRRIPKKYIPKGLSKKDKEKQLKSIFEGKKRPKLSSAPPKKRSPFVEQFKKKYGVPITDLDWIDKNLLAREGIDQVLKKGRAAYFTSGSRPNVSQHQWAYARLGSVLLNKKARRVDKKIWDKYKR